MTWASVLRDFRIVSKQFHFESEYHGAYNKLLYTLFPSHTAGDFTISPAYMPQSRKAADSILSYRISHKLKPVLTEEAWGFR